MGFNFIEKNAGGMHSCQTQNAMIGYIFDFIVLMIFLVILYIGYQFYKTLSGGALGKAAKWLL
jgi:hypothetical protein